MNNAFVSATGVSNFAGGLASTATQEIGGAANNGVLQNSSVFATGAANTTVGLGSSATQRIGVAR